MPTDGSRQAFTFGRGLGHLEGVIASLGLYDSIVRVSPMKWMKHYGLKRNKDEETKYGFKKRIKEFASAKSKQELTLDTCDSYLIAKYHMEVDSGGTEVVSGENL